MSDHDKDFKIYIPKFTEQYICVLLSRKDCEDVMGTRVSMEWIADKLKAKWEMKISNRSTT